MAATKRGLVSINETRNKTDVESLPTLLSRLGDDVMSLVNTQLALVKVELKEEANVYARGTALMALGGVIATVGFALVNVAVAFGVSTLFLKANFSQPASYALGFVITGVFYLVVGIVMLMAIKSSLAKQKLVPPRTVEELRKDKEWLKREI